MLEIVPMLPQNFAISVSLVHEAAFGRQSLWSVSRAHAGQHISAWQEVAEIAGLIGQVP